MKKIIILIVSILLSTMAFAHSYFTNIYFFGDSLSDMGNNLAFAPDTNPGANLWSQDLANKFGHHLKASNNGGTDFAYAGAVTKQVIGQVNQLLRRSGGRINRHALYAVWAGGNDLPDAFEKNFFIPASAITGGVSNLIRAARMLHAAGAKYIIIANLPNLGKIPLAMQMGKLLPWLHIPQQFTRGSYQFNNLLRTRLNHIGFSIIQLDIFGMMKEILANPLRFGFINTTNQFNTSGTSNPNKYLFWNSMHPTGATHAIIADYAYAILQGPVLASTMSVIPFSVIRQQNTTINSQIITNYLFTLRKCHSYHWRTFVAGNYMPWTQTKINTESPALHAYNRSITAGIYRFISAHWFTGGSYQYTDNTTNFNNRLGGFDLNSHLFSLFAGYQATKAYIDAIANYDYLDFDNFHRIIPLGITYDSTYGSTHGRTYGVALQGGYWIIRHHNFVMGPYADVNYQDTTVDSLTERGFTPARQRFFTQDNEALFSNLGIKTNFVTPLKNATLITQVHVSYDRQWLDGQSSVGASTLSLSGSHYYIPVAMPEGDAAEGGVAFSLTVHHCITFTVSYDKLVGRHVNQNNIGLNVSIPFS